MYQLKIHFKNHHQKPAPFTWWQFHKTFYTRNLQMSQQASFCPWQAFLAQPNVCGYGQKITLQWST
jgi:hypothetical protein